MKTYFLDPGIVSKAKRRRASGSEAAERSRGCIDPSNLEGKKDERVDIVKRPAVAGQGLSSPVAACFTNNESRMAE